MTVTLNRKLSFGNIHSLPNARPTVELLLLQFRAFSACDTRHV
eukprot:COSAG02_NODE_399_length_23112_cov_1107.712349_2_plen_43_part_00